MAGVLWGSPTRDGRRSATPPWGERKGVSGGRARRGGGGGRRGVGVLGVARTARRGASHAECALRVRWVAVDIAAAPPLPERVRPPTPVCVECVSVPVELWSAPWAWGRVGWMARRAHRRTQWWGEGGSWSHVVGAFHEAMAPRKQSGLSLGSTAFSVGQAASGNAADRRE